MVVNLPVQTSEFIPCKTARYDICMESIYLPAELLAYLPACDSAYYG